MNGVGCKIEMSLTERGRAGCAPNGWHNLKRMIAIVGVQPLIEAMRA